MQLKDPTGYADLDVKYSKPLDLNNLPEIEMPAPPRKPRWYHRFFNFGGNKRVCQNYDNYIAKQTQLKNTLAEFAQTIDRAFGEKRTAECLDAEKTEQVAVVAAAKEAKAIKELKNEFEKRKPMKPSWKTGSPTRCVFTVPRRRKSPSL